jgi:DNA-binding response OmpR family regulator
MRVLLIEDEKSLSDIIKKGLEEEEYAVDTAYTGSDGLFMAENYPVDLIILDIMLPEIDGITILKKIRNKGNKTPVIILTAKDTINDKILGLDSGAEDYLTKPFSFEELLARIRVLLRKHTDFKTSIIKIDNLVIDMNTHQVKRGKKEIFLTAKEYALLEYMALNKNKVLTRTNITEHIYDFNFNLDSNVIDVFIKRIRNKIDEGFNKKLIWTLRGAGYILKDKD